MARSFVSGPQASGGVWTIQGMHQLIWVEISASCWQGSHGSHSLARPGSGPRRIRAIEITRVIFSRSWVIGKKCAPFRAFRPMSWKFPSECQVKNRIAQGNQSSAELELRVVSYCSFCLEISSSAYGTVRQSSCVRPQNQNRLRLCTLHP